jgi:ABC-2 type transport system ATP-binding protein
MEYVLKTTQLSKLFSGVPAVNRANMNVKRGDIYGFIGRNGAGKTTMLRMVVGLASPTSGEMELFGSKDLNTQRARFGSIIEAPALYPFMTARDNMEVQRRLIGNPQKDEIAQLLKTVGLDDTGNKKVKNFSLGMKQRLAIALALLGKPDVLILDEPTNGLDPMGIMEIRELVTKLNRENGITFIISSHILGELSKMATNYGIINKGILVEEFSSEQLEERCKKCILIKTPKCPEVTVILDEIAAPGSYEVVDENTIRLYQFMDNPSYVNQEITRRGVYVDAISVEGQDLEGYFMDLMGGIDRG